MNRLQIKTLNSTAFLIMLFLMGILSINRVTIPKSSPDRFLSGATFRAIENTYRESFPQRSLAVGFWAALQYTIFREGRPGVVVGKDDWLFSSEEFRIPPEHNQIWFSNLERIKKTARILESRNQNLLIVLVPEKADIFRNHTATETPHNKLDLYGQSRLFLEQAGIRVVDLKKAFSTHAPGKDQLFFRTDTHWTPRGAEAAAQEVSQNGLVAKGSTQYAFQHNGYATHSGDLTNFIPTGEFFSHFGPKPDRLELISFEKGSEEQDLFAEIALHTALVGTSYSADNRWKFHDWLQFFLKQEIPNFSQKGHGPFAPMETYLANWPDTTRDIQSVIWEIPVRYLLNQPKNKEK